MEEAEAEEVEVVAEAVAEEGAVEESVSPVVFLGFRGSEKRLEETDIVQECGFPPFCQWQLKTAHFWQLKMAHF